MFKALNIILVAGLLVLSLSDESLGGRGGGGGGRGGSFGGGGGGFGGGERSFGGGMDRSSFNHTPSFNTPGAGANFSRSNFGSENRSSLPQNMNFNRSNFTPGSHTGTGQLPNVGQGLNPGQRGTIGNIQGFGENRTGFENRANFDNRQNFGNRTNIGNRTFDGNVNQFNINRAGNFNRPNYGNWYHGDWHGNWDHAWHGRPATWWGAGFVAGWGWGAATAPWSWGYWSYYNPYYTAPIVIDGGTIDYSQPIVVAAQGEYSVNDQAPDGAVQSTTSDEAMQLLGVAREAFMQGDYQGALSQIDKAIIEMPNDAVLHEFRGLTLFALKRYQEAAATEYAVLSIGPGWDWTTLISLYPNVEVYTKQLRDLEQYSKENPKSAEAHFLLAYHYLTCGHTAAAATEFKYVVQINPKDQLSAQLLASISTPTDTDQPKPSEPSAPPKPVDAAGLVGNWKAARPDGASISLNLAGNGKYTWKFVQKDKPQEFSGDYTVADNLLILKQGNNPVMVGQVTLLAGNTFNFKLAGDNPNDPGLTFSK